jgi:hypothetical protein
MEIDSGHGTHPEFSIGKEIVPWILTAGDAVWHAAVDRACSRGPVGGGVLNQESRILGGAGPAWRARASSFASRHTRSAYL